MKNKSLQIFWGGLFLLLFSNLQAQNIEFTKDNFPNSKKELKIAVNNIEEGDKRFAMGEWKFAEAFPFFEKANNFNPNNAELNYKMGRCSYVLGDKEIALTYFEKAHRLKPHVMNDVVFWIASLYHEQEDFEKAIQKYNEYRGSFSKTVPEHVKEIEKRIEECKRGIEMQKKPVRVFIDNFGGNINTEYPEYQPIVNADESVLFFTSRRPSSVGGQISPEDGKYFEDIYYSSRSGKEWSYPVNPGAPINTEYHNAVVGLSPDGQTLFVYSGDNGGDIYECQLKGNTWTKPKPLNKYVNTKYHESSVSLSSDSRKMYFVSDRPGSAGKRDIWVTEKDKKGRWTEAKPMPNTINTPYDEEAVFAHPDGKTLYFSSKGHNGIGGFDVYKTTFKDGQWTKPENLGYPINTPGDDVFFSISASGRHGYYSSARKGGQGDQDIYVITFLGEEKPMITNSEDNLIAWKINPITETVIENAIPINDISMVLLRGRILDGVTQEPVEASIVLTDIEKNEELATFSSNSSTGKYLVSLPSGMNYGLAVTAKGYLFHSENFNIDKTSGYKEIDKDIYLKKIEVGSKIVLKNIFFDFNKATLRPESKNELDRLIALLREVPNMVIEISGHTDNRGSAQINKDLSEKRAKSVVEYLIQNGIATNRLTYVGYGFDQPIAPNDTDENRQLNRRTEFKILKN